MTSQVEFSALSPPVYYSNIQIAFQIPLYCTRLARLLEKQPPFQGMRADGQPSTKCKVVCLESRYDAKICDIFNQNATNILGPSRSWPISSFGEGSNGFFIDENHRQLHGGIMLYMDNEKEKCPLEYLKASYLEVLEGMQCHWKEVRIEDHPDIYFMEDSAKFALFVKTSFLIEENALIRFIVSKIGGQSNVKCYNMWLNPDQHRNQIYLWVRKSALEDVIDKFGFRFQKRNHCVIS